MTSDDTARARPSDEQRDRAAAQEWIQNRAEGIGDSDIDGLVTVDDASTVPDPDAYGRPESDTLAAEDHTPASRTYPRPDAHGGITEADRRG
ncbi:hypothetical protein [Agreia sp. COWG]|uniref:hypothetical protein n=1 Tax=Agreia sp. COWG TaxID=2773266 RepID=UPI0019287AE2|nr:hypothetical protein [Agreia sp. COWG]CAD6007773.1 conserved protein of unknown function [Agreia sp. COWG]